MDRIAESTDHKENGDFLRAVLDRLHAAIINGAPLQDAEFWQGFERDLRHEWGGERPYIGKTGKMLDELLDETISRDREICAAFTREKVSVTQLAQKYGLSRQHVYRIVAGQR